MGSRTSRLARQVARSRAAAKNMQVQTPYSQPRVDPKRVDPPSTSSAAPNQVRTEKRSVIGPDNKEYEVEVEVSEEDAQQPRVELNEIGQVKNRPPELQPYTEGDRFRDDWFPNAQWEEYPIDGNIEEMAKPQRSKHGLKPIHDPEVPHLRTKEENKEIIDTLNFIGKGLRVKTDPMAELPKLQRSEHKMPKSRMSMPEKKLKGYLDLAEFRELYKDSDTMDVSELARKYDTSEDILGDILQHTKWINQPSSVENYQQSVESQKSKHVQSPSPGTRFRDG